MKLLAKVMVAAAAVTDLSGAGSCTYYHFTGKTPDWPLVPFVLGMVTFVSIIIFLGVREGYRVLYEDKQ